MPETKPAYDLFVLIDPEVPEERRADMVEEIRKRINAGDGTLTGDVEWGTRKLAYEISHRSDAYYHLFQLEASPDLLETLRRSLAIEDGVLRHRIMRLPKGAPAEPPQPPAPRHAEPVREGKHPRRSAAAPGAEASGTAEEAEAGPPPVEGDTGTGAPSEGDSVPSAPGAEEPAPGVPPADESAPPAQGGESQT
jgi:small subunit ribosomal protein S6